MSQLLLPKVWKWVKLPEIAIILMGQSPPSSSYNTTGNGLPFFQGKTDFGEIFPTIRMWCSEPQRIAEPNDILLSVRAPVGPTNLAPETCCIGRGLAALRPGKNLEYKYLLYFFRWLEPRLTMTGQGSTFQAITKQQLEEIDVPLPPLPVQRAIVTILNQADAIHQRQLKAEAIASDILSALFVEIFGDPVTNPKKLPIVLLGSLISEGPQNGLYQSQDTYGTGTPIVRIDNFYGGVLNSPATFKRLAVDSETKSRFALEKDDILINRVNSLPFIGKCALVPELSETTVYESNIMRLRVDMAKVKPEYVIAFLTSYAGKAQLQGKARGAVNQVSINQQDVRSLTLPLAPLSEQKRFLLQLESLDSILSKLSIANDLATSTYSAFLDKAFDGRLTAEWEATHADLIAKETTRLTRRPQLALLALVAEKQRQKAAPLGITSLMKYAFLAQQEGQILRQPINHFYDFVPYHFGPFAKELYSDLNRLEAEGWLTVHRASNDDPNVPEKVEISLAPERANIVNEAIAELSALERADLIGIIEEYGALSHNDLLNIVYERYPAYARKSHRRRS